MDIAWPYSKERYIIMSNRIDLLVNNFINKGCHHMAWVHICWVHNCWIVFAIVSYWVVSMEFFYGTIKGTQLFLARQFWGYGLVMIAFHLSITVFATYILHWNGTLWCDVHMNFLDEKASWNYWRIGISTSTNLSSNWTSLYLSPRHQ